MKPDLLQVIEAAHQLDGSPTRWLQELTNAVGPLLDEGYGAYGVTIDASGPHGMRVGKVVTYRGSPVFVRAIQLTNAALSKEDVKATYLGTPAIVTATERVGVARWNALARPHSPSEIVDCAAVIAADARGVGCMINVPMARLHRYPPRVRRVWARVSAHVVAMQRLRRGLARLGARQRAEGEAVLSSDGKVRHAEGPARSRSARALLRAPALDRERARSRLRRDSPEEAVELWRALVDGRWSIVDRFNRDGRRFLIAHENELETASQLSLTTRERQVVTCVAMGHSNKLVAYELGLSVGAVSSYLRLAMRKLGLSSRLDLARLLRSQAGATTP